MIYIGCGSNSFSSDEDSDLWVSTSSNPENHKLCSEVGLHGMKWAHGKTGQDHLPQDPFQPGFSQQMLIDTKWATTLIRTK